MDQKIKETLEGLKDFQAKTVSYVFEQLYQNGRSKMLIADEVGLGKTIVAKGIIAKAFSQFKPSTSKKEFTVIYICSNKALARQNLKKLNFTGNPFAIDYSEEDDRLTALAYLSSKESTFPFRIKAFTPATSFDDKTSAGKADERILLYRLLYQYSDLNQYKNSLKWILKGHRRMSDDKWDAKILEAERFDRKANLSLRQIKPKVYSNFRKALESTIQPKELPKCFKALNLEYPVKYWSLIRKLCELNLRKNNYYTFNFTKELISSLRYKLSRACIEFLQADIFILDEFQRYKKLIDTEKEHSPAIELAKEIFKVKTSKILMLSATPFKAYTNDYDELNGEVHYFEFLTVLKFLMNDQSEDFWKMYEADRKALFGLLRHPDKLENRMDEARNLKIKLEELYRTSIVRTEKLLASSDKDALIKYVKEPIKIHTDDINDFVVLDKITMLLNDKNHNAALAIPIEYVKSCPFALSFLDHYQHKEKIRNFVVNDSALLKLLMKSKHAWVNFREVNAYKSLIPAKGDIIPNAKLRLLLDKTVRNQGWQYLWVPPSIPYYEFSGAYKNSWGYSKTLIFSSWKMVPKMVASLVSYEAERLSIGNPDSISEREKREKEDFKPYYFSKKRSPRPQFTFKVLKEEQEPQQMNNFSLTYPSSFLANLYDPVKNLIEKKSLPQIKKEIKERLILAFRELNINQYVDGDGDLKKWSWLAPLLIDKASGIRKELNYWFKKGLPSSELSIDTENLAPDKEENTGKQKHFSLAASSYLTDKLIKAAKLDDENLETLCAHLAEITIGSPSICFLRSQLRYFSFSNDLLDASFNVSSAFLTMLNKPESIAVVRLSVEQGDYWEKTLSYMIDGNIQAMLDEFVFLLIQGEGIQSAKELSDFISDILSIRTASSEIDDLETFLDSLKKNKKRKKTMRSHYAVDFGTQKFNTAKGAGRQINVRQAFNSPFRPFVLASTSIGQEGLDFHFYCKRIFHWNLPSNPIDFEQREGRIHRYQGQVIRLNLADKYNKEIDYLDESNNVWKRIFQIAEKEKQFAKLPCDLVPFWHTETINDIKIERYVPLYPFSRDIEKFNNLIKTLAFYRLTFGQPRQEELVEALHNSGLSIDQIEKLDDLMINLSPIKFMNEMIEV